MHCTFYEFQFGVRVRPKARARVTIRERVSTRFIERAAQIRSSTDSQNVPSNGL